MQNGSDETFRSQVFSMAGKVPGKYSDWLNLINLDDDNVQSIDRKTSDNWKPLTQEQVLIIFHEKFSNCDIKTKLEELQKGKGKSKRLKRKIKI